MVFQEGCSANVTGEVPRCDDSILDLEVELCEDFGKEDGARGAFERSGINQN